MIPDHEIIFVQQRNDKDCGVACLAMACNVSYDLANEILSLDLDRGTSPSSLLNSIQKFHYLCFQYVPSYLIEGRLYIVAVPSLNFMGGYHYIVVDWRNPDQCLLYDPNSGREGRKVYGYDCNLISYAEVIEILKGDD